MKKINATATITKEVIAEISITDKDMKLLCTSCWLIAMRYMETNFPGIDDWKWEDNFVFDDESDVIGHWLITIRREVKTLVFDEKE